MLLWVGNIGFEYNLTALVLSFLKLTPCFIKQHRGGRTLDGRRGKKWKGRDSKWNGYYTFFITFPGTKSHQSLSEIERRGVGKQRQGEADAGCSN